MVLAFELESNRSIKSFIGYLRDASNMAFSPIRGPKKRTSTVLTSKILDNCISSAIANKVYDFMPTREDGIVTKKMKNFKCISVDKYPVRIQNGRMHIRTPEEDFYFYIKNNTLRDGTYNKVSFSQFGDKFFIGVETKSFRKPYVQKSEVNRRASVQITSSIDKISKSLKEGGAESAANAARECNFKLLKILDRLFFNAGVEKKRITVSFNGENQVIMDVTEAREILLNCLSKEIHKDFVLKFLK